jgi:hypothetical protein
MPPSLMLLPYQNTIFLLHKLREKLQQICREMLTLRDIKRSEVRCGVECCKNKEPEMYL